MAGFSPNIPNYAKPRRSKKPTKAGQREPLPSGSGFDKLVGKRADRNNLPGPTNAFGDRLVGRKRRLNTQVGNPRHGQEFTQGQDKYGRKVNTYRYGGKTQRFVVPGSKKRTFSRYV